MPQKGFRSSRIGDVFGHLTIIGFDGKKAICQCECGRISTPYLNSIRRGFTISCGCYRHNLVTSGRAHYIHGHGIGSKSTPTHNIWVQLRQRCENPKNAAYERYGGRGIKVCERWHTFTNFLADMGERPPERSLDRINNDGNYEPGNCRWATRKEQANNRRERRDAVHLEGKRFYRLLVLSHGGRRHGQASYWLCRCDCGKEKLILEVDLRNGGTKSCGCYRLERINNKLMKPLKEV